jgi:hypothetical protein
MKWIKCEYFYSWIDRPYYLNNDFKQMLDQLELGQTKLTKHEWSLVRRIMIGEGKKARRFSDAFI